MEIELYKVRCTDCQENVLAKAIYAHIVIRHRRVPEDGEIHPAFYPLPQQMRRLLPHLERIISAFLREERRAAAE